MHRSSFLILVFLSFGFHSRALDSTAAAQTPPASAELALFPNAKPLTMEGDIASKLVAGVDRFLLKKIAESETSRPRSWQYRFASVESFQESIEPKRKRLAAILGALDERVASPKLQRLFAVAEPAESEVTAYHIHAIRWPILADPDPSRSIVSVYGEGLLLEPVGGKTPVANVVAIPDCDQSPSQICGLKPGIAPEFQFARRLAERNCRVVVPMLISRKIQTRGGRAKLTNREYIYRSAYELGRHVIGYEVQSVRAVIDSFDPSLPVGVIGSGEGGRLALAAAAIDQRIGTVCLGGSFGASESVWQDPADRNVFGWLSEFGNAEMLTMVAPRSVVINHANVPSQSFDGVGGGAPGTIRPIPLAEGQREVERARSLIRPLMKQISWHLYETDYAAAPCNHSTIDQFLQLLTGKELPAKQLPANESAPLKVIQTVDDEDTQQRLVEQLDRHNQLLLRESPFVRRAFMSNLDASSLEAFTRTSDSYRQKFREETIGRFDEKLLPPSARIRKTWDNPNWTGFEVVLDVFPDVIAYGVLILPKDLKPGERRPVVVCQHGLEGRPTDTFLDDHRAYHDFAAKLAERGFITFAPQNLYLFKDRFRTLQRKANPLGKTLFSVIVPQHQQIVDWLQSLSFVDADRIGFYGLSYGGKSAMRIPALVTDYALSICSADFNEWVRKNASTRHRFSYVGTGEYEIFEWNLGSTFNYAEMAALICPRPFMVERGHFDGVGTDEWVAYEYAKVRNLYAAQLKIGDRTEIEWFDGPHTINGQASFDFLHRHLNWPKPRE